VVVTPVRERLLDAAEERFFQDGIAVTGVDQVAGSAGVANATLYKHFGSKDNLLRAVLSRRLTSWTQHWDAAIEAATSHEDRLLAIFDAVDAFRADAGPTQWCCFLATASERPRPPGGGNDTVLELVEEDTRRVVLRLEQLARDAGCDDPARTAAVLLLLYNGVLSSLLRGLPHEPAGAARRAAALLMAAESPSA
jgi:AcrR family transcriptional regulator